MSKTQIISWLVGVLILMACSPMTEDAKETPVATPNPTFEAIPAAVAARQALADRISIETSAVTIQSVEEAMWRDSCLGVTVEGQICLDVITPGFKILLEASGKQYEAHTDENGSKVVFVDNF